MNSYYDRDHTYSQYVPAKKKKKHWVAVIAALLVLVMLCSGVLGFFGGMAATRMYGVPSTDVGAEVTPVVQKLAWNDGTSVVFDAAAVAAATMDSVVEITTESITMSNRRMGQYISEGAGSGVIISNDGKIVTNCHVIDGAGKITVRTRDGNEYAATLLGSDEKTDLAVLKIDASGLKAAVYGNSGTLVVGEPVLAIGNPLGELGGTVTDGIVSALGRQIEIDGETMTLLQTNASINPGNSGGGLFDSEGKLIGIVNAKSSGSGIEGLGFAIPIDSAVPVIEQLIANGYVTGRVDVGMTFMDVSEQAAFLYGLGKAGVYVSGVTYGGCAASAGLRRGDRIVNFDGKTITNVSDLETALREHSVGDTVKIGMERDGKQQTVSLTLGEQKPSQSAF